jgi:glycosyltransferase involved in cell wall biosynthesis
MSSRKVLFVLEGGGSLSQDFVRGIIYKDLFAARGISAHYMGHLFAPPSWLMRPSSRNIQRLLTSLEYRLFLRIVAAIGIRINRQRIIHIAGRYDVIVLVKVSSLSLVKKIRQNSSAVLAYDMSDAVWLPFWGTMYSDIRRILSTVDVVTWDYKYTLEFAKQYNPNTHPWPAASQVELFDTRRGQPKPSLASGNITLGWLGSSTTAFNLYEIWEALEHVFEDHPNLHLRLVGAGTDMLMWPHFERVSYSVLPFYSSQQMIDEVLKMDIGLFPLFDVQDSCIRGFLKALVYMSGEAAVIASPRGQVPELIKDGVNGMLANTTKEWIDKLERLIADHELRRRIASAGLETVRRDFSLGRSFEALLRALGMDRD